MADKLPEFMRSAQWTTRPIESTLKLNASTPLPSQAHSLPKQATLVKIAYSSINPVDYKMAEVAGAKIMMSSPYIPCSDYAGTVIATTLSDLKPGDKVAGWIPVPAFGALAEYAVIKGAANVVKLPEGTKLEDAATLGVAALTAYQSIKPFVKSSSRILINGGSGGVGTFGIQIAKILGCHVTAVCSGANTELCKSLGADEVFDYKSVDVIKTLKDGNSKYDLIVDYVAIAGPLYMESQHYLNEDGRYISVAGGPNMASIIGMAKMFLPSFLGGGKRPAQFLGVKAEPKDVIVLAEWIKEGKMKTCIEKVYPLEEAAEAFKHSKTGRTRGKLVIKIASDQ